MKDTRVWVLIPLAAGLCTGLLSPAEAWADELYEYGEYLSSECTTCHQLSGKTDGIPSITGWSVVDFISVLESYRYGLLENDAMRSVAKRLSKEDIEALAVFFREQGH